MLRRNSIFIKILVPVITVMLIQILLIGMVLFVNGTIKSLDDNAVEMLRKNMENRRITLENMLVHNMSNLARLENDMASIFSEYLGKHGITIDDVLGNSEHETNLINSISDSLIAALRQTSSTGVFMCFVDSGGHIENGIVCNGLYYRDLDPVSTPADYSDILFLRGFVNIARKDKIQLDSMWSETFVLSPDDAGVWNSFIKPFNAALESPHLSSENLSYWSAPHLVNPSSPLDSNECISYTRPFFIDGRPVAVIGTEMQVEQLKKYFPATDFDYPGKGGYILTEYDESDVTDTEIICEPMIITGSYINRLFSSFGAIPLNANRLSNIYTVSDKETEDVHVAIQPLRLYNAGSPFHSEKWALASVGADSVLFQPSRSVVTGILYSTSIALVIGIISLAFFVRLSTKPLISIAEQIKNSDPDDPIAVTNSNTYEISLLCSTINTMREKRRHAEEQLREERERYLVALESAADTFIEYNIAEDSFILYYFSPENKEVKLFPNVGGMFIGKVEAGDVCHPDDIEKLAGFLLARVKEPIEIRTPASLFPFITDTEPDNGYYWFLLKASYIYDGSGEAKKIIGAAREITAEKRAENALVEASRHDITTGFYNRDYGLKLAGRRIRSVLESQGAFAVCAIRVSGFEEFEAHYGRVFGGLVLARICREMLSLMSDSDVAVRLNNDEFMLYILETGRYMAQNIIHRISVMMDELYMGDDPGLRLGLCAGAVLSSSEAGKKDYFQMAYLSAQHAVRRGSGHTVYYEELSPGARNEKAAFRETPISISLNISRERIVGLAFDLFEHTTDIHSVINMLLFELGEIFALSRIIICSYDADFGANQVIYQWNAKGIAPHHHNIEKIPRGDFSAFEQMMDENGTLLFDRKFVESAPEGIRQLLCASGNNQCISLCCSMYEGGVNTGRILFMSGEGDRIWTDDEIHDLNEISRIISTHISMERSNSASRAKSEFLSRMSHEIRTPMNAIIGMTGIAKKNTRNPEYLEDCLNKIDFSAKHLLALINDVLEMSRIESGKLEIKNEPFSLSNFAVALDTLMRPQIEDKGITYSIDLENTHDIVDSDEYRLRQVLVNFLGNAAKFTEPGGTIVLSIRESEAKGGFGIFRFSVKDTGAGISREDQQNVFKAFEQAEKITKKQREGTGLGLAISNNIVRAMGGRIDLASEPGAGSEFSFILRLKLAGSEAMSFAAHEKKVDYKEFFCGKNILLVEDNELNIEIACDILDSVGFNVDIAKNGREAVDKFFSSGIGHYGAILMDIQMPVMDGLTATREIRKNASRPDAGAIPIIAMTADAFDEDMKKSIESGMNGHIAKPVDTEKLYMLLDKLLFPLQNAQY